MKIKAKITISRNSNNVISIRLVDEASSIEFFDGELSLADFASTVTGLSYVEMDAEVRGLGNVGKLKVRETRSIVCPLSSYSRDDLRKWLTANGQEEGWILNDHLNSQNSVSTNKEGKTVLNYSVYKFVEKEA